MPQVRPLFEHIRFTALGLLILACYLVAAWLLELQGGGGVGGALLRLLAMPGYFIGLAVSPVVEPVLRWLDPARSLGWWFTVPLILLPFLLLDMVRALLHRRADGEWAARLAATRHRRPDLTRR